MVQINFGSREVSCKVVFYGPGMSGKTTNLEVIHKKAPKETVGEMVSIATETDRTLYFDFLPMDLGQVAGMRTRFQLYTVPGQIYYNATRKLVLQGVDGVIFVADSSPDKMAENIESLNNLRDNLAEMGLTIDDPAANGHVPVVLQYNKRDLPGALSVADMNAQLNPRGWAVQEACARDGKGVFTTLKDISRLVIEKLNKEHAPAAARRRTGANLTPVQPAPVVAGTPPATPTVPAAAPAPAPAPTPAQPQITIGGPTPPRPAWSAPQPAPAPAPRPAPAPAPRPAPAVAPRPVDAAKDRHLSKPKPAPLEGASGLPSPELGRTDPNLKSFRGQPSQGGGLVRTLVIVLLFVLIAILILGALALFVPAVRALLPIGLQQQIEKIMGETSAPPTSAIPADEASHAG
jgi:signal recognition particle receptor subunit beta